MNLVPLTWTRTWMVQGSLFCCLGFVWCVISFSCCWKCWEFVLYDVELSHTDAWGVWSLREQTPPTTLKDHYRSQSWSRRGASFISVAHGGFDFTFTQPRHPVRNSAWKEFLFLFCFQLPHANHVHNRWFPLEIKILEKETLALCSYVASNMLLGSCPAPWVPPALRSCSHI